MVCFFVDNSLVTTSASQTLDSLFSIRRPLCIDRESTGDGIRALSTLSFARVQRPGANLGSHRQRGSEGDLDKGGKRRGGMSGGGGGGRKEEEKKE